MKNKLDLKILRVKEPGLQYVEEILLKPLREFRSENEVDTFLSECENLIEDIRAFTLIKEKDLVEIYSRKLAKLISLKFPFIFD